MPGRTTRVNGEAFRRMSSAKWASPSITMESSGTLPLIHARHGGCVSPVFRMSFDDFMQHFEKMEICNLGPDVMEEVYSMTGVKPTNHTWSTNSHDGSWRRGVNAGGCRNYLSKSFLANAMASGTLFRNLRYQSSVSHQTDGCGSE